MAIRVALVSTTAAVRDAVEHVLNTSNISVHQYRAFAGADMIRHSASVVLCTLEADWQSLIKVLNAEAEISPAVILLMPEPDPRLWAFALTEGAFDAVAITDHPKRLRDSIEKANARWQRAQSVREALKQNKVFVPGPDPGDGGLNT